MKGRTALTFAALIIALPVLWAVDMAVGSTRLSTAEVIDALLGRADHATTMIVCGIRLVKAVVAMLAGAALSVSGLQMQTMFRNPLAGPYVLGITSGASLGVALAILGAPLLGGAGGEWFATMGIASAAWIGSALTLALIVAIGIRIKNIMVLLILGMMFSSGVGAVVQVLQYLSREEALKSFVLWTMGSLGDVTTGQLWVLVPSVAVGLIIALASAKPLNLLLLGERYAVSMGLNVARSRRMLLISTSLLAGTVTAFCGPIGFIGLAMPHVTRALMANSDHRVLLPATILSGAAVMLICDIVAKQFVLPINSITAILGIPIVVWIVVRNSKM